MTTQGASLAHEGCVVSVGGCSLDPAYIKAYYRRGSANYALGKYKDALKDFRHVVKVAPKDRDAVQKMKVRGGQAGRQGQHL